MANPTPWSDLSPRERRQRLIAQSTPSESQLQALLNSHARTSGQYEFQSPIATFWVDFLFPREKLVVELDGAVHVGREAQAADKRRTRILNRAGYRVLRFWNSALRQPTAVMVAILNALDGRDTPPLEQAVYLPQDAAAEIMIETRAGASKTARKPSTARAARAATTSDASRSPARTHVPASARARRRS